MKNYSLSAETRSIIIAPNAFKGTLEASEFCRILIDELQAPDLSFTALPMCDGGDGTARIIASYLKAIPHSMESYDALGRPHTVTYYTNRDTAIVDLAGICGLKDLHPQEYDICNANTAGLGKVLLHIAGQGIHQIVLGIGGSASVDAGIGALAEMGLKIVKSGNHYRNHLIEIEEIIPQQLKENFRDIEFTILCDVENPLSGSQGAARIFGPQKGATPLQIIMLEQKIQHFARLLLSTTGKDTLFLKHAGAAGGVAAAFHALLDARLISGADFCLQISGFKELLDQTQLVITGEGKLDAQTRYGKLPGVIASLCHHHQIPVVAIAGIAELPLSGFSQVYTLLDYAENLPASMRQPGYYLRLLARNLKRNLLKLI